MNFIRISFIIYLCIYVLLLFWLCHKNGNLLKTFLMSALSGMAVFTAVNLLSHFTGVSIPVNAYTLSASAGFGIPGVLGLMMVRIIL